MFSLQPPGKRIVGRYIVPCSAVSAYPSRYREEVARNLCRDAADTLVVSRFVTISRDELKFNETHTIDFYAMSQADFDAAIEAAYTAGRRAEANMYSWASVASTKSR